MTELILFGIMTGFISGFFGIGGGMVLVPILVMSGYLMKEAIAISIMQMVFSSIYGSYLNFRKGVIVYFINQKCICVEVVNMNKRINFLPGLSNFLQSLWPKS